LLNLPEATLNLAKLDEATKKSLGDLQATDPELDMERIEYSKDPLLKDCYEWILNDPILQKWRDGNTSPLLWIKGDPGKGKTMLLVALARELENNPPQNPRTVAFFFCQNTDPRLNTAPSILRGLIWRLAVKDARLANVFHTMYQSKYNQFNGPNAIYALFSTLLAMLKGCPGAFILIDALDECSSGTEREQLLDLIVKYAKSSKTKWLLSSRNDAKIKQVLMHEGRILSLELNEQHISKAVHAFIEQKASEFTQKKMYSPELKEKVMKELIARSDSTFLWVALACKRLLRVPLRKALSTLQDLPPGLHDLYARMMDQILQTEDEEDQHFCLRILRSATLAFRPLLTEELITTAGLPLELLDSGILNLIELCGSFITVRKGILYFIHQSAKDYLAADGTQKLFSPGLQKEHGLIVDRSLDAMSQILKKDMCILKYPGAPARSALINTRLRQISYVCSFWVAHLVQYLGNNSVDGPSYQEYFLDQGRVYKFLLKHLLHWFEALSLFGEIDKGITGLYSLGEKLTKSPSRNIIHHKQFVHDAIRVFRKCRTAVEEAPLQVYYSALIFPPEESVVRQTFKQETLRWISSLPRTSNNWNPCLQMLEGHGGPVYSVAFFPNGQQLASGSSDGIVRLWDTRTGKCLQTLEGHKCPVLSIAFPPDGQQLASGSSDGSVLVWDISTGKCLQTLWGIGYAINSVAFSFDGQQLASGSYEFTVWLWDTSTWKCVQKLSGHYGGVHSLAFSSNGQLASGSEDGTVRLWNISTGKHLQIFEDHAGSVLSVAFSSDGLQLASSSREDAVRLWDVTSGRCLQVLKGHLAAFSPDGQQLASGSNDDIVRVWDVSARECLQVLEGYGGLVSSVAFSPDGQQLASSSIDGIVRLWDTSTRKCSQTLEGYKDSVVSITLSPDGQQLASGSNDGTVRLWNTGTGKCLQTLEGRSRWVWSVAFSPDGQQLASGSSNGTIRLWNTSTGKCLQTLESHRDWVG
jgi:WD40 repeat protein